MCDEPTTRTERWQGWLDLPAPSTCEPIGRWIDLTHPLSADVPRIETFDPPSITRVLEMPADPLTVSRLEMVVHVGTHVDAPNHFLLGAPAVDEIPLARLTGAGVVARIESEVDGVIRPEELEAAAPGLRAGDILAIDTGWSSRWGTSGWSSHPCLSTDAAEWIVDRQIKLVAIDTPTPDLAVHARPEGFDWPVHQILLERGVLISEQVANLSALDGQRAEFVFAPLPIVGSDGGPARVIARPIADS